MDREDTTMTPTLTRKTSILPVGAGTLLPSPTTRSPSFSRPDGRESTTGNWPVLQSAAPPVVKVSHHASTWILHIINTERKKDNFLDSFLRLSIWFLCLLGFRYSIFHCVSRLNHVQVSDALCDSSSKPTPQEEACNLQPCPALWETTLPLFLHPFHPERKLNTQYSVM